MNEHESPSPESPAKEQPGELNAMVKRLRSLGKQITNPEFTGWHVSPDGDGILLLEAAAMIEKFGQGWIPVSHVICFEGEGAQVLLCRGWQDCRTQFFNGLFGSPEDWNADEVSAWDKAFADDDNWVHDEDRRQFCFREDIGEISSVRLYALPPPPERP